MTEHTPAPSPVPHYLDPDLLDLVPGDPPVPVTIWRTTRTDLDTHPVGSRLARQLIAAYSRPGDIVVDLTGHRALAGACHAGARRHHDSHLSDTGRLTVAPTTRGHDDDGRAVGDGWFGDDLTDEHLPPPGPAVPPPAPDAPARGNAALVVATCPTGGDAAGRVAMAWLVTAAAGLLRSGGCLVLVTGLPTGTPAVPQDLTE